MKKIKIGIVALLSVMLVFGACKKYEDGPAMSLLTKKARITGTWEIVKMTEDGNEISGDEFVMFDHSTYTLNKDGTGSLDIAAFTMTGTGYSIDFPAMSIDLEWEFSDDKDAVKTRMKEIDYETGDTGDWEEWTESTILRLTNKEFWTTETEDGKIIEIHMEKQ